jgi:hypothetical protein
MPSRALVPAAGMAMALALGVLVATAPSAFGATAAGGTPYCRLDVETGALTCSATEEGLSGARLSLVAAASVVVLGRLYDDINRSGPYLELTASGPCDTNADVDWEVANVGSTWNDRTSSFQGFNGCQVRVFENASFGGASYGPLTSSDYVGSAMNDRTTSVRFS